MAVRKTAYGKVMTAPHLQTIMTAQEYILTELEKLKEPIKVQDIGDSSLEEAVLARVMSKKFRKLKVDQDTIDFTRGSIKIALEGNKPLSIGCVHGGTKLWRFDEYPEVDWAELFNMIYYAKWMRYIAAVYEPGVVLEYFSMDIVQQRLNNLPRSETNQYTQTFKTIINWFKRYLPDNIRFTYRQYGELYDDISQYDDDLEKTMEKTKEVLKNQLPILTESQVYMTELNVRASEDQLKDPLWKEKVELMHLSVEETEAMRSYINEKHLVPVCPTPWPGVIATGSTKRSFAKFWVAVGALEKTKESLNEIVLTPKQLESTTFAWEDVLLKDLPGKNFSKIRILDSKQ